VKSYCAEQLRESLGSLGGQVKSQRTEGFREPKKPEQKSQSQELEPRARAKSQSQSQSQEPEREPRARNLRASEPGDKIVF